MNTMKRVTVYITVGGRDWAVTCDVVDQHVYVEAVTEDTGRPEPLHDPGDWVRTFNVSADDIKEIEYQAIQRHDRIMYEERREAHELYECAEFDADEPLFI